LLTNAAAAALNLLRRRWLMAEPGS
jgi:hypothetical protein